MRRRRQKRTPEDPSINLTPLIDVVFVVLIMFIIVAPLLEMEDISLAPASRDLPSVRVDERNPIQIRVKADNTILLNRQVVTSDLLATLLTAARAKYPDARPLLFHDKRAAFGTYQEVKRAVEVAGYTDLDLLLEPSA